MVWTIVLAIVGVIGLFIQFYIYILPRWRENKGKTLQDKEIVRKELLRSIEDAKNYKWVSFPASGAPVQRTLSDVTKDARLSKRLCDELTQLEEEIEQEYNRWLRECQQVIKTEIGMQGRTYPALSQVIMDVFGARLENIILSYEGQKGEIVHQSIYQGKLEFEIVKEAILKGLWGQQILREALESGDFHLFVEGLQELQERESIKALRDAQAKFIEKAQLILKEVF